jgi:hypothetical protein
LGLVAEVMTFAIDLNAEASFVAIEVQNVGAFWVLAPN